uniref:Uncharacterized protein n=1 Tax=Anguilla anguilla TaxID=7936 RepID=A0A0E9XS17_ANGAN
MNYSSQISIIISLKMFAVCIPGLFTFFVVISGKWTLVFSKTFHQLNLRCIDVVFGWHGYCKARQYYAFFPLCLHQGLLKDQNSWRICAFNSV